MLVSSEGAGQSRAALDAVLDGLTDTQLELVRVMAEAMRRPVLYRPQVGSDLVDDSFAEAFGNLLALHHAVHEEPLNKAAFEYALKNCALASGHRAEINDRRGSAVWDVRVDDTRFSCKTEAARGVSAHTLKIEKLMEARWIRECTNPARCAARVSQEVPAHLAGYDRILVLRAFREPEQLRYLLEEPPRELLRSRLTDIPVHAFTKEGARESYGANIEAEDGTRIFRILLDSSVEKVRLAFSVDHCQHHGEWVVPVALPTEG